MTATMTRPDVSTAKPTAVSKPRWLQFLINAANAAKEYAETNLDGSIKITDVQVTDEFRCLQLSFTVGSDEDEDFLDLRISAGGWHAQQSMIQVLYPDGRVKYIGDDAETLALLVQNNIKY